MVSQRKTINKWWFDESNCYLYLGEHNDDRNVHEGKCSGTNKGNGAGPGKYI